MLNVRATENYAERDGYRKANGNLGGRYPYKKVLHTAQTG